MPKWHDIVNTILAFGIDDTLTLDPAERGGILARLREVSMARRNVRTSVRERKVELLPLGPHASYIESFARLAVALAQARKTEYDLGPGRQQAFWGVRQPFHEHAIARLYDWWDYDQTKLTRSGFGRTTTKPRITLNAFLTRPGNLAVEWQPDETNGSDWTSFYRTSGYGPYRPSNELMFIRDVRALNPKPAHDDSYGPYHDRLVDAHILACAGAAIDHLEQRLKICFELRWKSALVLDWAPRPDDWFNSARNGWELTGWHIEDVLAREARGQRNEMQELLERTERDAEGFVALLIDIDPDITLEALRSESTRVRLQKKLRARGITMTPAPLVRLMALLEQHQAELLRPLWRTVSGGLQVVK